MLLAVDIGNTNISCGIFKGPKLIRQFDISAEKCFKTHLIKKLKYLPKISASVICSVVPKQTSLISDSLASLTGRTVYIIGKDFSVPIKNLYRKPKQAGQDRLVNSYAASIFYHTPSIVIDSGTAVTFDIISRRKEYLGGLITPGMGISLKALKEKTALLPEIKLSRPKTLIGKDTKSSILSGIVFGAADLSSGIVRRIKRYIGKNTTIIGTGGNIDLIQKYSNLDMKVDKDLTLKGINLIYEYASKKHF
ncbi:MAG: type III pantothenate kinase [Candidatus Omnitrophica bacterium]|jgi:type III pantothenate kinase|nr:type III pantothenate kinase [Candidatus Omnitrophota bacterium]